MKYTQIMSWAARAIGYRVHLMFGAVVGLQAGIKLYNAMTIKRFRDKSKEEDND